MTKWLRVRDKFKEMGAIHRSEAITFRDLANNGTPPARKRGDGRPKGSASVRLRKTPADYARIAKPLIWKAIWEDHSSPLDAAIDEMKKALPFPDKSTLRRYILKGLKQIDPQAEIVQAINRAKKPKLIRE